MFNVPFIQFFLKENTSTGLSVVPPADNGGSELSVVPLTDYGSTGLTVAPFTG